MHPFTDTKGRQWRIEINLGAAMQVKSAFGVDLLTPEAGDPPLLSRLATDEFLLGSVICQLLSGQMGANSMTEADVYAAFDGTTLLAATDAFFAELADFFQSRGRTDRAAAVRKQTALMQAGIRAAEAKVEAITTDAVLGPKSGALPE